jgi:GNAT superfamily N-acetyltransferase
MASRRAHAPAGGAAGGPSRRFRIRAGGPRDAPIIARLIRGLAEYERLAHGLEATPGRIRRHGFGRRRYFETLICRRAGRVVGFALYFFTYSTFQARPSLYLEDLFVLPDQRGQGAGRALLAALGRIAVRRGCGRMEWTVLDWNRPAIGFYKRLGARLHKEWILTRLSGASLKRLAARRDARPRRRGRSAAHDPRRSARARHAARGPRRARGAAPPSRPGR